MHSEQARVGMWRTCGVVSHWLIAGSASQVSPKLSAGKVCERGAEPTPSIEAAARAPLAPHIYRGRAARRSQLPETARDRRHAARLGRLLFLLSIFLCSSVSRSCGRAEADAGAAMPRCLMAKKWKVAPAAELADESDEEIDVVGEGRGRSPAPAATAPGPSPRDPEPTLLYNGESPPPPTSGPLAAPTSRL